MREKRREKSKEVSEESDQSQDSTIEKEGKTAQEPEIIEHTPEVVIEEANADTIAIAQEEEAEAIDLQTEESSIAYSIIMPSWGSPEESEWMYGIPPRDEDVELWGEEWSDFVLQWAKHNEVHVLSLATFIGEPPFKDLRNKVDAFKIIAQVLIDKEVAEWTDKRKRQLRIYWKPLEDWADLIYAWSLKTGKLRLDVKSIIIQEIKEPFARLPENDLYIIMGLMVEKGFAEWIDRKKGAVLISI